MLEKVRFNISAEDGVSRKHYWRFEIGVGDLHDLIDVGPAAPCRATLRPLNYYKHGYGVR